MIHRGAAGVTFNEVLFENNEANSPSDTYGGGGMMLWGGTVTLTDVVFKDNKAVRRGGGIFSGSTGTLNLNRVSFIGNTATVYGGALGQETGTSTIHNAVFSNNKVIGTAANNNGGAVYIAAGTSTITNATFSNNNIAYVSAATVSGGALYRAGGTTIISNSIFWGNTRGGGLFDQIAGAGTGAVTYSDIQGGFTGTANLDVNPSFVDATNHDLHLNSNSALINKGDNAKVSAIPYDRDGHLRVFDTTVDIGAYEYQSSVLSISSNSLSAAQRGVLYNHQLTASGGSGSYTWSLSSGTLPAGITLNNAGLLSGYPLIMGTYTFEVKASDGILTGVKSFSVQVTDGTARIYVKADATGNNTGSSWSNALIDLKTAIAQSSAGDEIWVAKGVYSPGSLNTSSFTLKEGVKIYGGFAGTETAVSQRAAGANGCFTINESVLDGQDINFHVVFNNAALSEATLLDGFTITRGNANSTGASGYGGGIYNSVATVKATFANLVLRNNKANIYGAGIYNAGVAVFNNLLIENNVVNGGTSMYGGGVYNTGVAASFNKITFQNNTAAVGGGLYTIADITIGNSLFEGNKATANGGGMVNAIGVSTLTDVVFKQNLALSTTSGGFHNAATTILNRVSFIANESVQHGGGMYSVAGSAALNNVVFSRNKVTGTTSSSYGGGMYNASGISTLTNVTFSNNSTAVATLSGGALYRAAGTVNVYNSIFWGNTRGAGLADQVGGTVTISNSLVQGGYAGSNNLAANPNFENASFDDLRLKNGSLAIDAGNNANTNTDKDIAGNIRTIGNAVDMGAYENPVGAGVDAITIMPASIAVQSKGVPFSQQLTVSGNTGAVSWEVSTGSIPPGMVFNTSTGSLSGTPTFAGTYTFVISATDGSIIGNRQYTFEVAPAPTRFYVKESATGINNGTTWTNAFNKLQSALGMAKDGDEIWVSKGNYSPAAHVDSAFAMVSGVKIYGGFAGTETALSQRTADANGRFTINESVLDGQDISYHVIFNSSPLSETTILDGFTATRGNAASTGGSGYGGGIYNSVATVKAIFANLVIRNNKANIYGAGIYNVGVAVFNNL
ncbi:MAG TPA: putative Ig domain-containing protein, partial [Flavisolibacter sp.]|nr:putative Ig domain-containing protein [Flavisolibacter sp.]